MTENPLFEHLGEMLQSLGANKGEPYAKVVAAVFSQTNFAEIILQQADCSDEVKMHMGANYGVLAMQLAGCIMWYEMRRRHPEFESYELSRKEKLGKALSEEFAADLNMLHNKQMEFMR